MYRTFLYFCKIYDTWSPLITFLAPLLQKVDCKKCARISHSPLHSDPGLKWWRGESSGWKWLITLFVHPGIWSTSAPLGARQRRFPASGIKLPFAPSPEAAGMGSFPTEGSAPPQKPSRVVQPGPTSELSTLSEDDIYDVEMACYLFSTQRIHSPSASSFSFLLFPFLHKSVPP